MADSTAYIVLSSIIGLVLGGAVVGFIIYSRSRLEIATWKTKYELTQNSNEEQKQETQKLS